MEELQKLKAKIRNAQDLRSLVKVMKAISAANIREYEEAVLSLNEYSKTIEMGLQIVMRNRPEKLLTAQSPEKGERLGAVIFGSEQGLVGEFNDVIARYAIDRMMERDPSDRLALAVGDRVTARLEEAGQPIDASFSFSGSQSGITQVMLEVLLKIEDWRLKRGVDQIVLFFNKPTSGAAFSPSMIYLYPLDVEWLESLAGKEWPSRTLPTFSMDADKLFSALIRQYLFFSLYSAFIKSLASENASRLLSMQLAEKNIEDHLSELTTRYHRQRQAAISSELLDILTGFEAL